MPDYLSSSACRGRRPKGLSVERFRSRPDLVAKLLRERAVARFVVAPDGFGKTQLALEYADVVFSFSGTFWFDALSPCFLRDLDKGLFAEGVRAKDPAAQLVVFDAVPPLDDDRADAFSHEIDALLSQGVEVIVTMSPASDAYASRQADRVVVSGVDLMLVADEVPASQRDARGEEVIARVPIVAWGGEEGREGLIKDFVAEGLSTNALLIAFRVLAYGSGDFDDAIPAALPAAAARRELVGLAQAYPYLGIDEADERFEAPELSVEAVVRAFAPRLSSLAHAAECASADAFLTEIASGLLACGKAQRACQLAACATARPVRETWLIEHDRELADCCCLDAACALYDAARPTRESGSGRVMATEAARRLALGDLAQAFELAVGLGNSAAVSDEVRAFATIVARVAATDGQQRESAELMLERNAFARWRLFDEGSPALVAARPWRVAATIISLAPRDLPSACELWERAHELRADEAALVAASAGIAVRISQDGAGVAEPVAATLEAVAAFLTSYLNARTEAASAGIWAVEADRTLSVLRPFVSKSCASGLSPAAARAVRAAALSVAEQRVRRAASRSGSRERSVPRRPESRQRSGRAQSVSSMPPTLRVELFGGMAVSIGGQAVDARSFGRRKLKTLLALLALDAGREIPRDRLAEAIWPNSSIDAARKNIYSLWSLLKRALSLPDGSCPYLVRMPNGYKLDDAWFESDVRRVDEICRTLLFGRTDADAWIDSLNELGVLSAGGLMPCETTNDEIAQRRREYHVRIIDALVSASRRLSEEGDAQAALWFARAAFELERFREDVYCALMRAQIASGQRAAALSTFFECKSFLAEGLGIDPSAEVVGLYRSIIEEEATLEW